MFETLRHKYIKLKCNIKFHSAYECSSFFIVLFTSYFFSSTSASNNTILLIGLSSDDVLVFTLTLLTLLSLEFWYTSRIRAKGQELRGQFSWRTKTMSPTRKFLRSMFHLVRCCREGRYSLSHRRQNKLARYRT